MAFFGVTVERVSSISDIPNADRIKSCKLEGLGFEFVIPAGQYNPGDTVLYFPVDSILPETIIGTLGLTGKLSGAQKNRVRTVCLRGVYSQGVVAKPELFPQINIGMKPEEITGRLGVTKYDPPPVICANADLLPLPAGLSTYDIEGCDRYADVIAILIDRPVAVTEKVEGSNFSVTCTTDGEVFVNQRNYTIRNKDSDNPHTFWRIAQEFQLPSFAKSIMQDLGAGDVTVYGEAIGPGIQGNYYGLSKHEVRLFDIKVGNRFLSCNELGMYVPKTKAQFVPFISWGGTLRDWLNGRTIKDASNGMSALVYKLREGIVIKPMEEMALEGFGRVILKQRSPKYLDKTGN